MRRTEQVSERDSAKGVRWGMERGLGRVCAREAAISAEFMPRSVSRGTRTVQRTLAVVSPRGVLLSLSISPTHASMSRRPAPRRPGNDNDDDDPGTFVFERFDILFDTGIIRYTCTHMRGKQMTEYFNGITFASMKRLPEEWRANPPVDLIMAFGMASISHIWTGFCTPTIIVRAGFLRPEDVVFWQETFTLGLAEHFLVNQIRTLKPGTPRCLQVEIIVEAAPPPPSSPPPPAPPSEEQQQQQQQRCGLA